MQCIGRYIVIFHALHAGRLRAADCFACLQPRHFRMSHSTGWKRRLDRRLTPKMVSLKLINVKVRDGR